MYRRDYILRLIEQFARTLTALRDRILKRQVDGREMRAEIHEIARASGLDLDVARQLDPATLVAWLAPGDDVDEGKLWLMAELLYLEGLHAERAGEVDASGQMLDRSRAVFARLPASFRPAELLPTAGDRVADIDGRGQRG